MIHPTSAIVGNGLWQTLTTIALLNLAYFGVEFAVALKIGSVALFADSADFLEDAAVSFLILMTLTWTDRRRGFVGMFLSGLLLFPALAMLWTLWVKVQAPVPPEPLKLSITALGALAINVFCAFLLARYRHHAGSMTRAAFLSARNDACTNIAIVGAGLLIAVHPSVWPAVAVGLGIAWMNADAAKQVWHAARQETKAQRLRA